MDDINSKAAPSPFLREKYTTGFAVPALMVPEASGKIPVHSRHHRLPIPKNFEFNPVLNTPEAVRIELRFSRENKFPESAQALDGADHDIDSQEQDQEQKPPGMVHIEKAEKVEKTVSSFPEGLTISRRTLILGEHRSDYGRDRQSQQKEKG